MGSELVSTNSLGFGGRWRAWDARRCDGGRARDDIGCARASGRASSTPRAAAARRARVAPPASAPEYVIAEPRGVARRDEGRKPWTLGPERRETRVGPAWTPRSPGAVVGGQRPRDPRAPGASRAASLARCRRRPRAKNPDPHAARGGGKKPVASRVIEARTRSTTSRARRRVRHGGSGRCTHHDSLLRS